MWDTIIGVGVLVFYFALQIWILPWFGVST